MPYVFSPPASSQSRRLTYLEILARIGIKPTQIRQNPIQGDQPDEANVLVSCPGLAPDADFIVIGAHLDATPGSSGAVDNWSGIVMLAALQDHFLRRGHRREFVFAAFGEEEAGCRGSRQYLTRLPRAERGRILAMINLDCLGVGGPRSWTNRSADDLEAIFARAAELAGVPFTRQVMFGFLADGGNFLRAGVPAITLHSLPPESLGLINGPADSTRLIDPQRYRQAFLLLCTAIAFLDQPGVRLTATDRESRLLPADDELIKRAQNEDEGLSLGQLPRAGVAWRCGLRPGDRLVAIDQIPVGSLAELRPIWQTVCRGQAVPVQFKRQVDGVWRDMALTLAY